METSSWIPLKVTPRLNQGGFIEAFIVDMVSGSVLAFFLTFYFVLGIIKKAREFQKNIYFCFIDYAKAFDCVNHNKLWKILQEMGIPDHLTCLSRNLYAG